MRRIVLVSALVLSLLSLEAGRANEYEIDAAHSSAQFSIRHMMVSNVRGEFKKLKGTVYYDPQNLGASKVDVVLDAASIDTHETKRDDHLRSPDFLDVAKYATLEFRSRRVEKGNGGRLKVLGDLTIHGVTKEVTLNVTEISPEIKDPRGNFRMGASATAKVNRKDFGLTWNKVMEAGGLLVGEDVTITIEVELVRKAQPAPAD